MINKLAAYQSTETKLSETKLTEAKFTNNNSSSVFLNC